MYPSQDKDAVKRAAFSGPKQQLYSQINSINVDNCEAEPPIVDSKSGYEVRSKNESM